MSLDQLIREGKQFFDGGKIPDAIAKWQQVLLREPGNMEAQDLIRKARGAQRNMPGERTQTLRAFTEGLQDSEMSRRLADEKLKHGNLLLKQGRTAEAVSALQGAHDLDPARDEIARALAMAKEQYVLEEKVEEIYQEGLASLQSGQAMDAVTKFLRVLAVDEKHVRAKASLEKAKAAMAASNESGGASAARSSPAAKERAKELFRLGVEAYKRENLADAIQLWQEVMELDPDHPRASKYREKAMATLGRPVTPVAPPPPPPPAPVATPPPPIVFSEPEPVFDTQSNEGPSFFDEEPNMQLQDLPTTGRRVAPASDWDAPSPTPTSSPRAPVLNNDPFDVSAPLQQNASFDFGGGQAAAADPFEFGPPPGESQDPFEFGAQPVQSDPFGFDPGQGAADPFGSASPAFGQNPISDPFGSAPPAFGKAPAADPFAFGTQPAQPSRSAAPSSNPFDDFVPPPPPQAAPPRNDPFGSSDMRPDSPFVDFTPDPDTESLFGTTNGPRSGSISTTAADFLDEIPAKASNQSPFWGGEVASATEATTPVSPEAMLEEGRRSMAEERYEEAIHIFKKALETHSDNPEVRGLLERAVSCLSSREQLTTSLAQAEQAVAAEDWELAARHAARVLQLNPYLRRAQKIATEAHSIAPSRVAAPEDVSTRASGSASPLINPFAVRKPSVNALHAQGPRPPASKKWLVAVGVLMGLAVLGFYGYTHWEAQAALQAKERQAEEARQKQRREASNKAADAEEALKTGDLVKARDLFKKATELDSANNNFKTRLQETQTVLNQKVEPMVVQAQANLERSQYDQAITEADAALAIDPAHPEAVSIKTTAAHYRDTLGSSEEKIFRISNFQKFIDRGDEAFEKKDYEGAQSSFQIAFDLSPRNEVAQARMTKVSSKIDSLKLIRGRESAILDEALKLLESKKFRAANEKVQTVLEAVPDSVKAKEVLEKLMQGMERHKNLELYKKLAMQNYHIGKEAEAMEYLKKWLEIEPDSRDAKFYVEQLKGSGN